MEEEDILEGLLELAEESLDRAERRYNALWTIDKRRQKARRRQEEPLPSLDQATREWQELHDAGTARDKALAMVRYIEAKQRTQPAWAQVGYCSLPLPVGT